MMRNHDPLRPSATTLIIAGFCLALTAPAAFAWGTGVPPAPAQPFIRNYDTLLSPNSAFPITLGMQRHWKFRITNTTSGEAKTAADVANQTARNLTLRLTKTPQDAPFSITSDCPQSLPAKKSCELSLTFSPATAGNFKAKIDVFYDGPQRQGELGVTIPLAAAAADDNQGILIPGVTLLDFNRPNFVYANPDPFGEGAPPPRKDPPPPQSIKVGTTASKFFKITNYGRGAAVISGVSFVEDPSRCGRACNYARGFTVGPETTCGAGTTLNPGEKCFVQVLWTAQPPWSVANVRIESSAVNGTMELPMVAGSVVR